MTYATKQDLIDRYGEDELVRLTDTVNAPPSTIDDTLIARCLANADAEINGWIAGRYTTPLNPVPQILVEKECVLARYYYHRAKATERVRSDYEDAMAWLQNVAKGLVSLGNVAGPTQPASAGKPQISAPPRTFTKDTLSDL